MLRNYVTIAIRNILRNKAFSFINIFGLAAGLATCLLIILYIAEESLYDKHLKNPDRLYRIASTSDKAEKWAAQPAPLAFMLKSELPEVEQAARLLTFTDISKMLLKVEKDGESRKFFEPNGYYVDSTFFQIFNYTFVSGMPSSALNEPNTMVISQTLARKFFGSADPIGRQILINTPFGEFNYTVKAVFDDSKVKSHIPASYYLSMRNRDMWNWVQAQTNLIGNSVFYTYLKLRNGADPLVFEKKMQDLYMKKAGASMKAMGISNRLYLQHVGDIYLRSNLPNEIAPNGNIQYLYILGSIAVFILLIACINFMNLSTARSEKRAREVGVRKVMGAERSALVRQFLGESLLVSAIALCLALVMVYALLPLFNQLAQTKIQFLESPRRILWISVLTFLTGLISGLYPAFYLSSFRPASVLKGKILNTFSAIAIRKGLVVFQFTISVCLIIGALVVWKQLLFLKNQQLGFDKDQKIIIPLQQGFINTESNYSALKNEFVKNPEIKAVTCGSSYPGLANLNDMLFYAEGKTTHDAVDVHLTVIDDNYIQTLGFSIISGRSFSKDFRTDSASIILNETAVRQLGYSPQNVLNKKIRFDVNSFHGFMEVVGVVKNFNFESLHSEIKPFGFITSIFGDRYGYLVASVASDKLPRVLTSMEMTWSKLNPSIPFAYSFLDQDFQMHYEREKRASGIVTSFMVIAILIACLGLFGLTAFSAEQRKKEIGIRKVLGASVNQVTVLLSKEFLLLVALAVIIASPIAWWAMNQWLQSFAYRTSISWWMFAFSGGMALGVALATISYQAIRAALSNPVKSLRSE